MDTVYIDFHELVRKGDLNGLNSLAKEKPGKINLCVQAYNFSAFGTAAFYGHLDIMKRLIELNKELNKQHEGNVKAMVRADNFEAFRNAAERGNLNIMNWLIELYAAHDGDVQEMVRAVNFQAFQDAACRGHLAVVNRLIKLYEEKIIGKNDIIGMVESNNFEAFREAVNGGHLGVVERLIKLYKELNGKVQDMVKVHNFCVFGNAAFHGHINTMNTLIKLYAEHGGNVQDMVRANDFRAFRHAAFCGHLDVMKRLIELNKELNKQHEGNVKAMVQAMVRAKDFEAFRNAAERGHLNIMNWLIELYAAHDGDVQEMVQKDDFCVFRNAASSGHLDVMERLIELYEQQGVNVIAMVQAKDFRTFRNAAFSGHLDVMKRLIKLYAAHGGNVQDMVRAKDFDVFQNKKNSDQNKLVVMEFLIDIPCVFTYADNNSKYEKIVQRCIERHFSELFKTLKIIFEQNNLEQNGIAEFLYNTNVAPELLAFSVGEKVNPFDVDDDTTQLYFYMAKKLISRNQPLLYRNQTPWSLYNPSDLDCLSLLLTIPKVQELEEKQLNELLNLAISVRNQKAVKMLLAIPKVSELVMNSNDESKAQFFLGMVEFLIPQKTDKASCSLILLLNIPAVLALAHTKLYQLLHSAINFNNKEAVRMLLSTTAEGKLAHTELNELLDDAIKYYNEEAVKMLLPITMESLETAYKKSNLSDNEKAQLNFYKAKILILENNKQASENLQKLLEDPNVKELAYSQNNMLLKLAREQKNQQAASMLLAIPAVLKNAKKSNFHKTWWENEGEFLNLRDIAENIEKNKNNNISNSGNSSNSEITPLSRLSQLIKCTKNNPEIVIALITAIVCVVLAIFTFGAVVPAIPWIYLAVSAAVGMALGTSTAVSRRMV